MITPSFALTSTERVLPRMALDFTTATLDPRVTFTRTGNTATVINSSGLVAPINANLPRFDFNPTTLACRGLLIEESSVNLLTYSEDFSNVAYTVRLNVTVVASATTDPAGGTGAYTVSATTSNGIFGRTVVGTIGVPYTYSLWVRRKTGTGAISFTVGDNVAVPVTSQVTSSWNRISVTATPTAVTVRAYLVIATGGDEVEIYGAQLEQKAFGTSYIPTVASQVTRNADIATMTGTNFSDWYNASEGAFRISAALIKAITATSRGLLRAFNSGDAGQRIAILVAAAGNTNMLVVSTATQCNISAGSVSDNTLFNLCAGYKLNDFGLSKDAGTVATDVSGTVSTGVNSLNIGLDSSATTYLNGWLSKLSYYPQKLITAEIQAFSKG